MKILKFSVSIMAMLAFSGMNEASGQWTTNGIHIYNSNAGNVGIGNSSPARLLYVGKNMTEPTIAIRNYGGTGGATFQMLDDASGADWKFKATNTGGFKIRDNANGLDVIVIEPNSAANSLYISSEGDVGIGTATPPAGNSLYVTRETGTAIRGAASAIAGTSYGVIGYQNSTSGAAGWFHADNGDGASVGVYGKADGDITPNSCGVVGHHWQSGTGVGAWSWGGDLFRGFSGDYPGGTLRFYVNMIGQVYADGGYNTYKKILTARGEEEYRTFNSVQATESRIEDFGSSELHNGQSTVSIDPVFAQTVDLQGGYQVFLTPVSDDAVCLFITDKNPEEFVVKGKTLDGRPASCSFDYRIVARDGEYPDTRMELVDIPEPVEVPREDCDTE